MRKNNSIEVTITYSLFGEKEEPFIYDVLLLDKDTKEPFLVRHDGKGNRQYQARWNGSQWELEGEVK